jgi:putative membrane protein
VTPAPPEVGLDAFPFHIHWDIVGIVFALVVFYVYGIRVLADRHAPAGEPVVTRRQIAWFVTGVVAFLAVETWPVHDIGAGSLFTFHMVGHMVLALVVPPALLNGIPWWLLRLAVKPILPVLRVLTKPLPAIVFFNAVLALIHVPSVLEAMLTSELVHVSFHLLLLGSATLMWWPVIGPIPDLPKLAPPYAMGYLFVQSLVPTIPASFLTFATDVTYKIYGTFPRLWGLDAQTDQLIAGLIMKIGGGIVLWTAITVIWFRWAAEEERSGSARTGASFEDPPARAPVVDRG